MYSKERVAIIGSGNWGSAIAKLVGRNARKSELFDNFVYMWVFEEIILGKKLTTIINTEHENVKYLPGIKLPDNIIAESDIKKATQGATVLIFVLPHQFVASVCSQLKGLVTNNCKAITLIKGVDIQQDRVVLFSEKN